MREPRTKLKVDFKDLEEDIFKMKDAVASALFDRDQGANGAAMIEEFYNMCAMLDNPGDPKEVRMVCSEYVEVLN